MDKVSKDSLKENEKNGSQREAETKPEEVELKSDVELDEKCDEASVEDKEEKKENENSQDQVLEELREEAKKYKDMALRSAADMDNYRKRMIREKEEAVKYANTDMLERLIPISDNFELGLKAAQSDGNASAILSGMEMVRKQLVDFLTSLGVESIEAEGKPFDPNLHEAIAQEEHIEINDGHVIRQIRKGYKLRDRLIRPAHVIVSKGMPATVMKDQTDE